MSQPEAKIILDSVSEHGSRLTTFEVKMHRFVLAEMNTHRAFSRNSASSRAIPVEKMLARVKEDPAWPVEWPAEQPGMQGGAELDYADLLDATRLFEIAYRNAVRSVELYLERHKDKSTRLHKSLINRLLEPFMWHTAIITSTTVGLVNFFDQRCSEFSPLAQPEMRAAADAMYEAYKASTPIPPHAGWHMPYLTWDDTLWASKNLGQFAALSALQRISVARCARVSTLTHDGVRDPNIDLGLYDKLVSARPMHASPLEHVATPVSLRYQQTEGNFDGWHQLRHTVEQRQSVQQQET